MFDLRALRKIYDTGKASDVGVAGRSGGGVEALRNLVEAVLEQVPVQVKRHRGRLVSEHLLDDLDVGSCGDRQRGCGVAETMRYQSVESDGLHCVIPDVATEV